MAIMLRSMSVYKGAFLLLIEGVTSLMKTNYMALRRPPDPMPLERKSTPPSPEFLDPPLVW